MKPLFWAPIIPAKAARTIWADLTPALGGSAVSLQLFDLNTLHTSFKQAPSASKGAIALRILFFSFCLPFCCLFRRKKVARSLSEITSSDTEKDPTRYHPGRKDETRNERKLPRLPAG